MENSLRLTALVLLACNFPAISADECREERIRLSFRVEPPATAPEAFGTNSSCDGDDAELVCSNAVYPDEIACEVGSLRRLSAWGGKEKIKGIEIGFNHPAPDGESKCTLKFNSEGPGGVNFQFVGGSCQPAVEGDSLPPFKTSKVSLFRIIQNPGNYPSPESTTTSYQPCIYKKFVFQREGVIASGVDDGTGVTVNFGHPNFICEKYATTAIGGRDPNSSFYSHDGRRVRPT